MSGTVVVSQVVYISHRYVQVLRPYGGTAGSVEYVCHVCGRPLVLGDPVSCTLAAPGASDKGEGT